MLIKVDLSTSPLANFLRTSFLSELEIPVGIGPAGINANGKCPKLNEPITIPGTILSQTPKQIAASKTL